MCDTSQTPALGVMTIVPDQTAVTILPILQRHLWNGTTVRSDQWAAYNRVQQLQPVNVHNTVNHSLHFVDPATGVHTQNVESYWNRVKGKFKRMKGVHEDMLPSYLDEFMWRERHGRTAYLPTSRKRLAERGLYLMLVWVCLCSNTALQSQSGGSIFHLDRLSRLVNCRRLCVIIFVVCAIPNGQC
jgi:hypothetical protein